MKFDRIGGGVFGLAGDELGLFTKLALSVAILSVKKLENMEAREDDEVESGRDGAGERERSVLRVDHNLPGFEMEVEIRFLK